MRPGITGGARSMISTRVRAGSHLSQGLKNTGRILLSLQDYWITIHRCTWKSNFSGRKESCSGAGSCTAPISPSGQTGVSVRNSIICPPTRRLYFRRQYLRCRIRGFLLRCRDFIPHVTAQQLRAASTEYPDYIRARYFQLPDELSACPSAGDENYQ